jgi:hypothetical protein
MPLPHTNPRSCGAVPADADLFPPEADISRSSRQTKRLVPEVHDTGAEGPCLENLQRDAILQRREGRPAGA